MIFPDGLPSILEYRLGRAHDPWPICIRALPKRKIDFLGSSGKTNATDVCPRIPYGATGWRLITETAWRPMNTIPKSWLPFLNRARPSEMDCRKPIGA